MHNIQIEPRTYATGPGYLVSGGIEGTAVFLHSPLIARTVAHVLRDEAAGDLTAAERWDIIDALVRDDDVYALKQRASDTCDHVATWQGITMPSGYCAKCGAGPAVAQEAR